MTFTRFIFTAHTLANLSLKAEARRFYFGYLWWVIEPLLYVAVFYLVFSYLLGTRQPDFLPFLVVGKLTFIWFSKTLNFSANSLLNNGGLLGRMDMPKALFPVATVLESSYKQLAVFVLLLIIMLLTGYSPSLHWLWLIPLASAQFLLITVCAMLASLLACVKRDFIPLINLGTVFMLFVSGIFWDINSIANQEAVQWLLWLNPMAFLVDGYRQALMYGASPSGGHLVVLMVVSLAALVGVAAFMSRYSKQINARVLAA